MSAYTLRRGAQRAGGHGGQPAGRQRSLRQRNLVAYLLTPCAAARSALAAMAVSPLGDSVVVGSAAGGLFAVDLVDGACAVSPLTAAPLPGPVAALAWNARTGEVLAAAQACVCVFRPAH